MVYSTDSSIDSQFVFRRKVHREDLVQIKELQSVLFPVQYSEVFYENLLRDDYETILAFSADEPEALCGVATARMSQTSHEPPVSYCGPDEIEGYIMTLGVAKSARGMGLGSRLLKMIKEIMLQEIQCDILTLHVKVGNFAAFRLYKSHDFVIAESLPQHYTIDNKTYDACRLLYRDPSKTKSCLEPVVALCFPCVNLIQRIGTRLTDRIFGKAVLPL